MKREIIKIAGIIGIVGMVITLLAWGNKSDGGLVALLGLYVIYKIVQFDSDKDDDND